MNRFKLFILLLAVVIVVQAQDDSSSSNYPEDREYDYIIVGAGISDSFPCVYMFLSHCN